MVLSMVLGVASLQFMGNDMHTCPHMKPRMVVLSATKPSIQPAFRYIIAKILALLDNMQVKNSWGAISSQRRFRIHHTLEEDTKVLLNQSTAGKAYQIKTDSNFAERDAFFLADRSGNLPICKISLVKLSISS